MPLALNSTRTHGLRPIRCTSDQMTLRGKRDVFSLCIVREAWFFCYYTFVLSKTFFRFQIEWMMAMVLFSMSAVWFLYVYSIIGFRACVRLLVFLFFYCKF